MSDFLLELRSEEIPARMQAGARADLEKLFRKEMDAAGVAVGDVTVWSTPRRLALIARGLPTATAPVSEEVKGPRVGAPPQALEGFLRKTGLIEDQLVERDGVLFAVTEKPGRATAEVLAEAIPAIVRAFPWPKSQRWGAASISTESLRWVRPLSAIVALFDGQVVDCEVGGIKTGRLTKGHRFHSSGEISIDSADDYAAKLRAAHVIVSHEERQDLIRTKASEAAAAAGLTLVADEGLVIENAGLTEWPVPLLGRFDEQFLEVPPEVIQLTARTNQKYFVCEDAAGKLANAFVCTANIAAADGGAAIVAGNRKVLAARLSDARFFWEQDRKTALSDHAKKLERITFHEKLGTVADKVERVAKLARWLVEEGVVRPREGGDLRPSSATSPEAPASAGALADQAELAARLCKADLVTEMVGEFPELQGLMGGYYARAEGLPDAVADAIRDHYKPVGQGDDVPTAPVTVAVALADKLDNLIQFFRINEKPTGSKDPYALRRAALGILRLDADFSFGALFVFYVRMQVSIWMDEYLRQDPDDRKVVENIWSSFPNPPYGYSENFITQNWGNADNKKRLAENLLPVIGRCLFFHDQRGPLCDEVMRFFYDRLDVQADQLGLERGVLRAVLGSENIDRIQTVISRSRALQSFLKTEDGTNLLAGYKRAANILKKEAFTQTGHPGLVPGQGLSGDGAEESTGPEQVRADSAGRISLSYAPEPAEEALVSALAEAGPRAAAAVAAEDFGGAMAALATLRAPIDAFFDQVTVNDADQEKRTFRLSLLARFRAAVHGVADFSRIEG